MFKILKILPSFPFAFFLAAGNLIFSASSSYAVRVSSDSIWTGDYSIIGRQFTFKGILDRNINLVDSQSSAFPVTQVFNNNTSQVSLLFTGNLVQPGQSADFQWDIEDYPDGSFGFDIESTVVLATPTGVKEVRTGGFTFKVELHHNRSLPSRQFYIKQFSMVLSVTFLSKFLVIPLLSPL